MGIPLKIRYREVTPDQFEFAPEYGNLIVMQVIDEVVTKHGPTALLQEKPFTGIKAWGSTTSGPSPPWPCHALSPCPTPLVRP